MIKLTNLLKKSKELNRMDVYDTLKKCLDFCVKLNKIFKNKLHTVLDGSIDTNDGNFGIDRRDGKIKIFDL